MLLLITRRRNWPAIAVLCASGACPVVAQDALRNASREDAAYQARQIAAKVEPTGWNLGPVRVASAASFGMELTDNVRNTRQKEGDVILRPELHLDGVWLATDRSRLSLGAGFGYMKYLENSDLNRGYVHPDSELAYDITVKDFVVSLYDSFSYSHDVAGEASLSGVASLPRFDNTIGTRVTWRTGRGIFSLGYGHQNFLTTGSTNSYLDRTSEQFSFRAGYRFHPDTTAGWEVSGALTDYADETQRDNVNVSLGPYLDWKPREWLSINLRGGFVQYSFAGTNAVDRPKPLNSYYAGLEINHQLTDHISQALSAHHDVSVSLNQGSDYTETTVIDYSMTWKLRENTTASANMSYTSGNQPGVGVVAETEDFQALGLGLSVRQQLTRKFSGSVGYSFSSRESSLGSRAYGRNTVTVTLNYAF